MVKSRVRAKGPHPLQKHWVSPRLKMARSGQGRQRLKTLLSLDKVRKEPFLPSAKIRSRWRSHQIFGATALRFLIVGTIRSHSIVVNMILVRLQSELVRGFGIPASSSLPSLVPPRCLCFFFSSITGAIRTCLVDARAKLKDLSLPCIFIFIIYIFCFLFASMVSF